jgi:hypothetical protein
MGVDLSQTTKAIVQQLKQDPASVKDYPYKDYCQRSIDRLAQAAKFQPQDASHAIGSVEENKVDGHIPPLLTFVTSFLEINAAVKQRIIQNLAEVKQILR